MACQSVNKSLMEVGGMDLLPITDSSAGIGKKKVTAKDKRKGDRHRPGYWVEYGRKRRAKEREAKANSIHSQAQLNTTRD